MAKKRLTDLYSEYQLDLMRNELVEAKKRREKEHTLSWLSFAENIAQDIPALYEKYWERIHQEFQDPGLVFVKDNDHFRNFAQGAIIKKTGKKEELSDNQYIAIDLWLTDPNNKYSVLTREKLHGEKVVDSREAIIFANFLHENATDKPVITVDKFKRKYLRDVIKSVDAKGSIKYAENMTLITKAHDDHDYVLSVKINGRRTLIKAGNKAETLEQFGMPKEINYVGWLIIAPEDNLFMLLKNYRSGDNHIFLPICTNDEALEIGGSVDSIAFIDHQQTVTFDKTQFDATSHALLTSWVEENRDNLLIFNQ